jgi:hypothetical protein
MNRQMLAADLAELEQKYQITLLPPRAAKPEDQFFYPQFPIKVRQSAQRMARHYEIFYCLENWIRDLVREQLEGAHGSDWWSLTVPQVVRDNAGKNMDRERDAAISFRSADVIDYTTFGELGQIIEANWDLFRDLFNSRKGLMGVLTRLNLLRGPIAHCSELAPDEELRLDLSLRDLFRLME